MEEIKGMLGKLSGIDIKTSEIIPKNEMIMHPDTFEVLKEWVRQINNPSPTKGERSEMNGAKLEIENLISSRNKLFDKDGEMLDEKKIDEYTNKINELIKKHIDSLDSVFVLEAVTHLGCWPCIIYDDDGHWAVTEENNSPVETTPPYCNNSAITDVKSWKDNIRDAVKYYVLHYEEEE